MQVVCSSPTAEQTRAVGEALARLLMPGDAVALTGDLGAGKTTLVQGIARGLGSDDAVLSPTFTLVREYRGHLPIVHADVYRLDRVQDFLDLGLEESWERRGVLLVEWGDAVGAFMPEDRLDVELTVPDPADDVRRLVVRARGATWAMRWERLESVLEPWRSSSDDAAGGAE